VSYASCVWISVATGRWSGTLYGHGDIGGAPTCTTNNGRTIRVQVRHTPIDGTQCWKGRWNCRCGWRWVNGFNFWCTSRCGRFNNGRTSYFWLRFSRDGRDRRRCFATNSCSGCDLGRRRSCLRWNWCFDGRWLRFWWREGADLAGHRRWRHGGGGRFGRGTRCRCRQLWPFFDPFLDRIDLWLFEAV